MSERENLNVDVNRLIEACCRAAKPLLFEPGYETRSAGPSLSHRGGRVMSDDFKDIQPGDHVVATKWHDGDPSDHWCVGFYSHTIAIEGTDGRHIVLDEAGEPFRLRGFRRMERISAKAAEWILQVGPPLEGRPSVEPSIWTLLYCRETILEARAQGAAEEREGLMKLALGSEEDNYASYDGYVAEWLRSNTGEG